MIRLILVVACLLLWSMSILAETYSWTDEQGTAHFTDDFLQVPAKYRKKASKREDIPVAPAASPTPGKPGTDSVQKRGTSFAPVSSSRGNGSGLYAGKKAEVWQQEMRGKYAEITRLEQLLKQLEGLMKKPVGISMDRFQKLPQEFKETQKQYLEAIKQYNDQNDAANQVGLPAEYRK